MRIFFGVQESGFYHGPVVRGLRERGHEVSFVRLLARNTPCEPNGGGAFEDWVNLTSHRLFHARNRSLLHKAFWKGTVTLLRFVVLVWSLCRFSHFVFNFGNSLLPWNLDLPVLRLLGKRILFVFHGSDSRPSYFDFGGISMPDGRKRPVRQLAAATRQRHRRIAWINRWAHWSIDNPFSAHFHQCPVVNWYDIGLPVEDQPGVLSARDTGRFTIIHAPSVSLVKGTPIIMEVLERLAVEDPKINVISVHGKSHEEVFDALRECDLVVDQLYADSPCSGLVMEAAQFGKPSVVGGPGWCQEWLAFSGLSRYPSLVCLEAGIEDAIRLMTVDEKTRSDIAAAATSLAGHWHYAKVAERIEMVLLDGFPKGWLRDITLLPVAYSGCGLPSSVAAEAVRRLVEAYGADALCLNDKPQLLAKVLAFAESATGVNQTENAPGVASAAV